MAILVRVTQCHIVVCTYLRSPVCTLEGRWCPANSFEEEKKKQKKGGAILKRGPKKYQETGITFTSFRYLQFHVDSYGPFFLLNGLLGSTLE